MSESKMKVKIWSDIMCPFCYIGKRHYEEALAAFPHKEFIETEWQSFQLDPTFPTSAEARVTTKQYLMEKRGFAEAQIDQMQGQVMAMAKQAGLDFAMDKVIMANSFQAHRIIQLGKQAGLGDALEEAFFHAQFMEGADIGDTATLLRIGTSVGLSEEKMQEALVSDEFAYLVRQDIQEAQQLGVKGVPFFVLNNRYGISGAQPAESMQQTLEKAYEEWRKQNPLSTLEMTEGPTCTPDGVCS